MSKCAKCGKELTLVIEPVSRDMTVAGVQLTYSWASASPEQAAHVRKQLGKYAPIDESVTVVEFQVCCECQIDVFLGVSTP